MNNLCLRGSAVMSAALTFTSGVTAAMAQQAADEVVVSLEEIVITAERRAEDLQKAAISVTVLQADELTEQGKITTAQILESVPNVDFATNRGADNPNGNVSIRGVRTTQNTGGGAAPSATATYVDDVFQGIGGNFDVSRVEVLRGPQGTLYGRSATGGVVAFHTNNPQLAEFGANVRAEVGTANLRNAEAAINLPVGEQVAVRIAGHVLDRDGYYDAEGGHTRTNEGRVKALYQPSDDLQVLVSLTASQQRTASGGATATLTAPNTINYSGNVNPVLAGNLQRSNQGSLTLNYDLGDSVLTYVGALHTFKTGGRGGLIVTPGPVITNETNQPLDQFHTEEIRWASDSDGPFKWLVGANYFEQLYKSSNRSIQVSASAGMGPGSVPDTTPGVANAPLFVSSSEGSVENYGLFTENTLAVSDNLRVTGGLRYDKTRLVQTASYDFNLNINGFGNSLNPPNFVTFSRPNDRHSFNNVTYKARVEYDLTPTNMLYALTATGFLPGDAQISPQTISPGPGQPPTGVNFVVLPFEEEKMTSYEVGSKNRFLADTVQVNGALFYYDYSGKQEAVNTSTSNTPTFLVFRLPGRMYGAELDLAWLATAADKFSLTAGWVDAKYTSFPVVTSGGISYAARTYFALDEVARTPKLNATLGYEHTFAFGNGSTLAPRLEARYVSGSYVQSLTQAQYTAYDAYAYQDAYTLGNANATWTSPEGNYAATAYVRNVTDKVYKSAVTVPTGSGTTTVTPSDPRTWGFMVSAKF